jgi:hypothetical protein
MMTVKAKKLAARLVSGATARSFRLNFDTRSEVPRSYLQILVLVANHE